MSLEQVSFAITLLGVFIAIMTFIAGNQESKPIRYTIGGIALAFAFLFGLIGLFASIGNFPPLDDDDDLPEPPPLDITQEQVNALFGEGNWFCFPDNDSSVAVRRVPPVRVEYPLYKVDTDGGTYESGQVVSGLGATAWLQGRLSRDECPSGQQAALSEWLSERQTDGQAFSRDRIDGLLGAGNWHCLSLDYSVKVLDLPQVNVRYPITAIDNSYGRYGVGETVSQPGAATVWLGGSIPGGDCP